MKGNHMTVAELIKELQACPQDRDVTVALPDQGLAEIKRVVIWPDGIVIEGVVIES